MDGERIALDLLGCVAIAALAIAIAPASTGAVADGAQEPSAMDPLPEVARPLVDDRISEAELEDLRTIADQFEITLEAAIEQHAWKDNFALAAAAIREGFPDDFAGAEIVDHRHAWIAFAEATPAGVEVALQAFVVAHPDVTVESRPAWGFSEFALQEAIEVTHFAMLNHPDVANATTSYDYATQRITSIIVETRIPGRRLTDYHAAAISALLDAELDAVLARVEVSVIRSLVPVIGGYDSSSAHLGGENLSSCTSGFGVRSFGGTPENGIATAGHCGNAQSDDGSTLTFKYDYQNIQGDFQWHTGPKSLFDNFYAGSSTTTETAERDVSSVGSPVVGQYLCRNGKTSHKDCQDVRKLNVCHSVYCNLVQMDADLSDGGDSGGPVFYANTAYGLHQGWHLDPVPFPRDLFSRADRIDNAMSVNIRTN